MRLSSLLKEDLIFLKEDLSNDKDVNHFLLEKLLLSHEIKFVSKEDVMKAIDERESLGDTYLENGVAVPHARIKGFEDTVISVFVPKTPFKKGENLIKIMFLIITSESSSTLYLNTLSAVAKITLNQDLLDNLLKSNTPEEFLNFLDKYNINVKKNLTVEDIMSKDVVSVSPDISLKKLIDIFAKNSVSYLPVVDENNCFLGEVELKDVVNRGIPNYANMIGNLSFLSSFEPFEDLLKQEKDIFVKEIMKEAEFKIFKDASIIELAFKLSNSPKKHASVLDKNDKVVGVVSLIDIINKVLRA